MSNLKDFLGGSGSGSGSGGVSIDPAKMVTLVKTTSETWTVPEAKDGLFLVVVQGGGGGGGASLNYNTSIAIASGGGSGDVLYKKLILNKGSSIDITIGSGGQGVACNSNSDGHDGGRTLFGSFLSVNGGKKGLGSHVSGDQRGGTLKALGGTGNCQGGSAFGSEYDNNMSMSTGLNGESCYLHLFGGLLIFNKEGGTGIDGGFNKINNQAAGGGGGAGLLSRGGNSFRSMKNVTDSSPAIAYMGAGGAGIVSMESKMHSGNGGNGVCIIAYQPV